MPRTVMLIRKSTERMEQEMLHPKAARSGETKGRVSEEPVCSIRTAFQRDRDRILHSKAFRRLKHKTQVLIAPEGDHYRTRLTHSLEVAQVSRTIARALRLNEDLTESIALGHDLGHPPFGHTGEKVLNELSAEGFHHQKQGLRLVQVLENLNLTQEVLDGLEGLTPEKSTFLTLEAAIVDKADRMAYLHHDVEDARRAGLMTDADLPGDILETLGLHREDRLECMVIDMIHTSLDTLDTATPKIAFSPAIEKAVMALRQWMFEHIYLTPARHAETENVRRLMVALYEFYQTHPEALSSTWGITEPLERRIIDYIAGMTDRFALEVYQTHLLPKSGLVYPSSFRTPAGAPTMRWPV